LDENAQYALIRRGRAKQFDHSVRFIGCNREAEPDRAFCLTDRVDRLIDPDDLTPDVKQRSA
jgi:hypothetical protein